MPAGETLVLLGRSGSGKTTALRLINRLLATDAGRSACCGRDAQAWDPIDLRRHTGYVIQEVGLLPHLTVARTSAIVPRLLGWPDERAPPRGDELLALVGLPPAEFATAGPTSSPAASGSASASRARWPPIRRSC